MEEGAASSVKSGPPVPALNIDTRSASSRAPAAAMSAATDRGDNGDIEDIRAEARREIERYRQDTREISAELNRKRQEHMQKMLTLQKEKESLEGEIQAKKRELNLLRDQNLRAEQQSGASGVQGRRGSLTARKKDGGTPQRGEMTERRRSVAKLLAHSAAAAPGVAEAEAGEGTAPGSVGLDGDLPV